MTDADLDQLASRTFTPDRFVRVPDVCVFAEHETTDNDGQPLNYDRDALEKIIERCNERIADTGDFAVLTDGHTPDREDIVKGAKHPDVLGFVGPYRLGKIGQKKPRYAILADEWHFKDSHDKTVKLPRRSVELWLTDDPGERFFDPVAALGAETPRLDLGMKFARLPQGGRVAKYTAVAPSGGNTFPLDTEKESYMAIAPDDIKQIIAALEELDWVKAAKAAMTSPAEEEEEPVRMMADDEPLPEEEEPVQMGADEEPLPEGDPADNPKEEIDTRRYSRNSEVAKYQREADQERRKRQLAEREAAEAKAKYSRMAEDVSALKQESADARRESEIDRLQTTYGLDEKQVEDLREKSLYALGAKCSDDHFRERVEMVERYARPIPYGRTIPSGKVSAGSSDKQDAELSAKTIAYADRYRRKHGKAISYADAQSAVLAESNGKP